MRVNPYSVGVGRFDESGNGMAGGTIAMVLHSTNIFDLFDRVFRWFFGARLGSWKLEVGTLCYTVR